ncbi:hypothetical protein G7054_g8515 [Neopestalotiopsis clavispora]|jgi:hypothetical protein|nr:hypothetical protein G7054_g8515 [Neopestalotiopsis clavispora]
MMDSEDGDFFVKQLAGFVRTHEKALANALQFRRQSNAPRHGASQSVSALPTTPSSAPLLERPSTSASTSTGGLAAALSLGSFSFTSHNMKPAKLALTPHHLFYLLSRFEEMGINVGPMKVRLENLHDASSSANYVSFLDPSQRTRSADVVSIRSVSSVRSVMSGMSALWASFGIGSGISAAREEKQKAALAADLKYLYSAFTKIPCLRLAPDWRARLIRGYEEFPFDSAVPLYVFKNLQALEISGIDFRQFFGWDRMADQIRSLTLKRASIDDPADILIDIVLDDMDKRRRRTSKSQHSPTIANPSPRRSPTLQYAELHRSGSTPGSPVPRSSLGDFQVGSVGTDSSSPSGSRRPSVARIETEEPRSPAKSGRPRSHSPPRPISSRTHTAPATSRHSYKVRRSGSGSSHSSLSDSWHNPRNSASNLLAMGVLPASKWRFLKHLSLADNSLTSVSATSLAPLSNTLYSLDLSTNLFTQIPDSLATLTALRALNLSNCMIDSLHSLTRNPLPAITALNLRANRLQSIAGVEKLYPLERLDLRDNRLTDPMELARLTGIPDIREIWVEGNPFTRTHRDYRITIFNLFRMTPGFTEDVIIDASGPTYSEKRYLVERVAVPAAVPVVKPPVPEVPAVDVSKPTIIYDAPKEPAVLRKDRPQPKAVASENDVGSARRRRTPKRRIVDLATSDSAKANSQSMDIKEFAAGAAIPTAGADTHYRISQSPETPKSSYTDSRLPPLPTLSEVPRIDTGISGPAPSLSSQSLQRSTSDENTDWSTSGEMYRQKIETLRGQVGNGYLSVLNEESWESSRPSAFVGDYSQATIRPNIATPRTQSVQTMASGRAL